MRGETISIDFRGALGLHQCEMRQLGSVVALAGPNGSGKSRLLGSIQRGLARQDNANSVRQNIQSYLRHMKDGSWTPNHDFHVAAFAVREAIPVGRVPPDRVANLTPSQPSVPQFPAQRGHAQQLFSNHTLQTKFSSTELGSYLLAIVDANFDATHPESGMTEGERAEAIDSYGRLETTIETLLGFRLRRIRDGKVAREDNGQLLSALSQGQAELIRVACLLHLHEVGLASAILFWDEPEKHLHPSAAVDVIQRLREATPEGQLWIATHSPQILASVPLSSIYRMEDGAAHWAGRDPGPLVEGLFGDEMAVQKTISFLAEPCAVASAQFAAECLSRPPVLDTGIDDPQLGQAVAALADIPEQGAIIDFGAGKGRLAVALSATRPDLMPRYVAFDSSGSDAEQCKFAMSEHGSPDRYAHDESKLCHLVENGSAAAVLMINVLHEIDPRDWLHLFGRSGLITRLLRSDGKLFVIEDHEMRQGEHAHDFGFLVLDNPQLSILFARGTVESRDHEIRGPRLRAHAICAADVASATEATRREAIENLKTKALSETRKLRQLSNPSFVDGLAHARWTQTLGNAVAFLEGYGS